MSQVFYLVNWWGDLPSGLQEFRFLAQEGNATPQFRVLLAYEKREREVALKAEELVVMFTVHTGDIDDIEEADG